MINRRLVGLLRWAPLPAAVSALTALAAVGAVLGQAVCVAGFLSGLLTGRTGNAATLLLGALAFAAVRSGLLAVRQLCAAWTANRIKTRLRDLLARRVMDLGPLWLRSRKSGDTQAILADGVDALQAYVGYYLPQLAVSWLGPALLVGAIAVVDPISAVIIAGCVIVAPLVRLLWRKLLGNQGKRFWDAYASFAATTLEALRGMTTLKLLGATDRFAARVTREAAEVYRASTSNLRASIGVYLLVTTTFGIGASVSVALAGYRFATTGLELFALLLVLVLAAECFRPMLELQNYWHEGATGLAAAKSVFEILDTAPRLLDGELRAVTRDRGQPPVIEVRAVRYTYPGSVTPALDGVSLVVPAGGNIGLVGPSGSGKTTMLALLQRFDDPQHGAIHIGGVDLRRYRLADARSLTALVSQDIHLFHGTVRDNLLIARPDATDGELAEVLRAAAAADVVAGLPAGLSTVVGERGMRLSGGQRQRLAIARALLADAPVLLLDEATSSVDGPTERAIQRGLAELRRDRTTVVVAHRLSTVLGLDEVAVLEYGRVVEQGPPHELLATDSAFAELVALQVAGMPVEPTRVVS